MSRRFLDDIRSDLNTILVTDGETTADELRPLMIDMIDSTIQGECRLLGETPIDDYPVNGSFEPLEAIYDLQNGGDATFLIANLPNGSVTCSTVPGFTYHVEGSLSVILGSNDRIDLGVMVDGLQVGFVGSETGEGNNDPITLTVSHELSSATSDAEIQLCLRTDDTQDIDILSSYFRVDVLPTNNP